MGLSEIHKEILSYCVDDDTGLWLIVRHICGDVYYFGTIPDWLHQKTMSVVHDLLNDGLIEAGNFEVGESGKYSFITIQSSVNEIIDFIEQEWSSLGKAPNLGDVCWFRATEAGEKLAKELGLV